MAMNRYRCKLELLVALVAADSIAFFSRAHLRARMQVCSGEAYLFVGGEGNGCRLFLITLGDGVRLWCPLSTGRADDSYIADRIGVCRRVG